MPSVIDQQPFNEYTGNGVTTLFAYEFQVLQAADFVARINGVIVPPSQYTLTGVGSQAGGSFEFLTPPANGALVLGAREMLLERDTDYQEQGDLLADTVNNDFNRLWLALQQQRGSLSGAIRAPFPEVLPELPFKTNRINVLVGFNGSGELALVAPADGSAGSLALDLASTSNPAKGAGMVGFNEALTYAPYTIGAAVKEALAGGDGFVNIEDYIGIGTDYAVALDAALQDSNCVRFPEKPAGFDFESDQSTTLTRNTIIDWNGQECRYAAGARNRLLAAVVATGRTLGANAARYAKVITLNSGVDIQGGDLLFISANIAPSSSWADVKQDTVRVRSMAGAVATLDAGLNFAYNTADAGLTITVRRPVKVTHIRPNLKTAQDDNDAATEVMIWHEGIAGWHLEQPKFSGELPFDRTDNVFRSGMWFLYSYGGTIDGMDSFAMSYPVGLYGATRNVIERDTRGRYNHHSNADLGAWGSDYLLDGMQSEDSFQSLNTHACFRAFARNVYVRNDYGLSNWRNCSGGLAHCYFESSVDDTAELPQFQNNTPNAGYEYINADAYFDAEDLAFNTPNRVAKSPFGVRYGASVTYSRVLASSAVVGFNPGEVGDFFCGAGNQFGSGTYKTAAPAWAQINASRTRFDVNPGYVVTKASANTLNLPQGVDVFQITGTTSIIDIDPSHAGSAGRRITLMFDSNCTVSDGGGNLDLNGNFNATANDCLTLVCTSSGFWREASRSPN